ncbi:relaxase/mobilization nuclease domain-containing protein [Leisingera caerulea]|uniref:relaxase/mobilization nuclease domain-containing protein n=1 Tax=Leisingera caerulea TaxID=506591 RepID=UPI0021A8C84A|nr:relaxase/mobilization nuclease domain-containing protein [Leisingera caerulea]UWQ48652.1 relaxase/mobilization nuclease domain-containing protein [Leisingera caerulea]
MILKAKERGDAPQLARYLLADRDNDHVELHEVRGFASDDLVSAFEEAEAIASGTRCKNHLFSISLNPPEGEQVGAEAFERAIAQVEQKTGLAGQPRAIVFHEKDGRRHAHAVWSRIDHERMRAINLPHYKIKLRDVSRQLFMDHGWDMPRGLQDRALRDPLNFTRAEWQQARRVGLDPREIKAVFRQCWNASDNRASLERSLKERGFWLARGDRRGFVAVDYRGEVYALARYTGVKTKDIEARLGDRNALRALSEVKAEIAGNMTDRLQSFIKQAERDAKQRMAVVAFRKADMAGRHQTDRRELWDAIERRWQAETQQRAARLPKGFSGIWHRITGRYARLKAQNEQEALQGHHRDRAEKDALIFKQLEERQALQREIRAQRTAAQSELMRLREDVAQYQTPGREEREQHRERKRNERKTRSRTRDQRNRQRRDFEP